MFFTYDNNELNETVEKLKSKDSFKKNEIEKAKKEGDIPNGLVDYLSVEIKQDPITGDLIPHVYIKFLLTDDDKVKDMFIRIPLKHALLIGKMAENAVEKSQE